MALILGIDPGRNGAFAVLDTTDYSVTTQPIPADIKGLHEVVLALPVVRLCALEQIYAGPQMSRRTIGVMFENYGALKSALAFKDIPVVTVRPGTWKGALNIPADKTAARRRASGFFPTCSDQWRLAKDDGRAEAALIAWWGMGQK